MTTINPVKNCKKCEGGGLPESVLRFAKECLKKRHPRSYLIPVMHQLQKEVGYLRRDHLKELAELFGTTCNDLLGVATFYHYFTLKPKGRKNVSVCTGTACHVKGADRVLLRLEELLGIKNGETTQDGEFSISGARCLGMCALAPVLQVGKKVYGNVTVDDVEEILKEQGFKRGR